MASVGLSPGWALFTLSARGVVMARHVLLALALAVSYRAESQLVLRVLLALALAVCARDRGACQLARHVLLGLTVALLCAPGAVVGQLDVNLTVNNVGE